MNSAVMEGERTIKKFHDEILLVANELEKLMLESHSGADFITRLEGLQERARVTFIAEESFMREHNFIPQQHTDQHKYFMGIFRYLKENQERHLFEEVLDVFKFHSEYLDVLCADHCARLSLKQA